jgi:hypothetical protein
MDVIRRRVQRRLLVKVGDSFAVEK